MGFSGGVFTRTDGTRTGATVCQQQQAATTGIDPVLFDNELNEIVAGLETALLKDGTNSATANINLGGNKITNVANGTSSSDAVNFSQLSTLSPSGSVVMWAGTSAPSGWLLCDGSAVSRAGYASLFAIIGTTYGAGDGATTFNVPDLRQRFPLGKAASGTGSTLGGTGGAIDHVHTGPSHTHSVPALSVPSHTHDLSSHTHTIAHTHQYAHTHGSAAHSHGAGSLRAQLGGDNSNQGKGLWGKFDGANTFDPNGGYAFICSDSNSSYSGNPWGFGNNGNTDLISGMTTSAFTTGIQGNSDTATVTTNSQSTTTTTGASVANSGGPSNNTSGAWSGSTGTGTTGAAGTGNTGANNPPFLTLNFIIKT